jgi:arylsulfatase A-like enzyme
MRHASWIGLVLAITMLGVLAASSQNEGEPAPDIVLVSIDSLRADHLGCYGYQRATSPFIDSLAAEGVRFENAISTTSWTLPAHAALFTGLYDSAHGVYDDGKRLSDGHLTLAEVLQESGFATAGFFGGPYLHPTFGLAQGFSHYESCMTRVAENLSEAQVRVVATQSTSGAQADITGPTTVKKINRWLAAHEGSGPLFLFVHLWDVHYDYIPPQRWLDLFDPDYEGSLSGVGVMDNDAIAPGMPERDLAHLVALYDAEIRSTDDILEQIMALVARHRTNRQVLTIVTADHGEELLDHGGKGHHRTLYEEVVRIPLILHWPGALAKGATIAQPVRIIDLMPTILALSRVGHVPPTLGRDLSPLLMGRAMPEAPALSELLSGRRNVRAVRLGTTKLIRLYKGKSVVYDLAKDPRELDPAPLRSRDQDPLRDALRAEFERARTFAEANRSRAAEKAQVDDEITRRLEALGYVDPEGEAPTATPGSREER